MAAAPTAMVRLIAALAKAQPCSKSALVLAMGVPEGKVASYFKSIDRCIAKGWIKAERGEAQGRGRGHPYVLTLAPGAPVAREPPEASDFCPDF